MQCDPPGTDRINSFSLVSYLPGQLGEFLTALRRELIADCSRRRTSPYCPRGLFSSIRS